MSARLTPWERQGKRHTRSLLYAGSRPWSVLLVELGDDCYSVEVAEGLAVCEEGVVVRRNVAGARRYALARLYRCAEVSR